MVSNVHSQKRFYETWAKEKKNHPTYLFSLAFAKLKVIHKTYLFTILVQRVLFLSPNLVNNS